MQSETKQCQNCKNDFTIEADDFAFYEKINVLVPKICYPCRARLRLSFRNERVFYKRPCDLCKKDTISMYSKNKTDKVYCYNCWFSDDWDAFDFGIEYDENIPFFDQYENLLKNVPKIGLIYVNSPGSEYTNISADNKNCYMIVESSNNEDSIHSYWVQECRNVVDTCFSSKCELCYECDDCYDSYSIKYSKGCHSCRDSMFLLDCRDCSDCIGCVNLRSEKFCIFNKRFTKEEYESLKASMNLDTQNGINEFRDKFLEFSIKQPRKYAEIVNTVNSTGNYIKNAKNCNNCFHCYDAEDNKYGVHVWRNAKDCMDVDTAGRTASKIYNSINSGLETSNQICCAVCWSTTFADYSMYSMNCNNIFGCISLRKKNFCILNKQYSKEEYYNLRDKIIDSMKTEGVYGDFFPNHFTSFGYNESAAIEQFPLNEDSALIEGFKWENTERGTYGKGTVNMDTIKASANDYDENLINEIFTCIDCNKNFRIIMNELSFYKKLNIPIPLKCPDCRHNTRIINRGPNMLWHRSCMCDKAGHNHKGKCPNEFETSYAPDRPEIVYCENCYQKEII